MCYFFLLRWIFYIFLNKLKTIVKPPFEPYGLKEHLSSCGYFVLKFVKEPIPIISLTSGTILTPPLSVDNV